MGLLLESLVHLFQNIYNLADHGHKRFDLIPKLVADFLGSSQNLLSQFLQQGLQEAAY